MLHLIAQKLVKCLRKFKATAFYRLAKLVTFFTQRKDKTTILFGEKEGEEARDNAFSLFKYMMTHDEIDSSNFYYVSKRGNRDEKNLAPFRKNVVRFGSFKHFKVALRAKSLVVNDGFKDVYPNVRGILQETDTPFVYLQHGILLYKTVFFHATHYYGRILRFVISTDFEREIFVNELLSQPDEKRLRNLDVLRVARGLTTPLKDKDSLEAFVTDFECYINSLQDMSPSLVDSSNAHIRMATELHERIGFPESKALQTGLPRHDRLANLLTQSSGQRKTVFIFFTWRDYWPNSGQLDQSPFYRMLTELLSQPEFSELVSKNDLEVKVQLHQKMLPYEPLLKELPFSNVTFLSGSVDMQEIMTQSAVMITDYSSASLDFGLASVPVIFFQPDQEDYFISRGTYVNEKMGWIGPVALTPFEVARELALLTSGASEQNHFSEVLQKSYPNFGNSNTLLAEAILDLPPKIVFISYNIYGVGGTVRVLVNLANYLYEAGYQVEIISLKRHQNNSSLGLRHGIRVHDVQDDRNRKRFKRPQRLAKRLPSVLFNRHSDLYPQLNLLIDFRLARLLMRSTADVLVPTFPGLVPITNFFSRKKTKVLVQEHKFFDAHPSPIKKLIRRSYPKAAGVTTLTEADAVEYAEVIGKRPFTVANGVESQPFQTNTESSAPHIVTIGRLDPQKQFDLLIKSFALTRDEFPDWELHIYGKGTEKENLQNLIEELSLTSSVHLMGETLSSVSTIAAADICAVSSSYEGFGMVYIEAYAASCPVISFDIERGPKEIMQDGVQGLKAKPFEIIDYAEKLMKLMSSEKLRDDLGQGGRRSYEEKFDAKIIGKQFEDVVRTIVG